MRVALLLLASAVMAGSQPLFADDQPDPDVPTLRMVLFTPRDVTPPGNAVERLTQVARYTEAFFSGWMTRWGYEPGREHIFQWQADGNVEVLFAKGDRRASQYTDGSFRPQMVQQLVREHSIAQNENIWWIWVYVGDPPARFEFFRGSGNSKQGGWAVMNYDSSPGTIDPDVDLAAGFHRDFMLKGCIHELGHGFGLPHWGPRLKQDLGNTLMGPVTRIWEDHMGPDDRRGYLCAGSAAMLWKHPLFSGKTKDRGRMPNVTLSDYQARHDRRRQVVNVQGRVTSDVPAHSVIVVDDMDNKPGEYWRRAYVSRLEEDGTFDVVVDELVPGGGKQLVIFCFENGIVTGDGKTHGLPGAIEKPYRYVRETYQFE
jgi:hypothetical protein